MGDQEGVTVRRREQIEAELDEIFFVERPEEGSTKPAARGGPTQPGPDERRVSYAKSQRGRMTTGSIVSTRAADEEMEDGRIRNREAATKIRDAWIYKQIRARQVRAC